MLFFHPGDVRGRRIALLTAAMVCLSSSGCVQRRMLIRSNPPGAVVYIDDYEIGTTPVATNFTYYGTRKIRLVKNGYETLTVMQPIPAPWYQWVPVDFVAENLVPGKIHDTHTLDYQLVPQMVMPSEQLLDRAEGLRRQTQASGMRLTTPRGSSQPAYGASPAGFVSAPPQPTLPPPSVPPQVAPSTIAPSRGFDLPPSAWPPADG